VPNAAALIATLERLVAVLAELCALARQQREAVMSGDLERLLAITEAQELQGARLAGLEQQRQALLQELAADVGSGSLREQVARAFPRPAERERLQSVLSEIESGVAALRQENETSARLLRAAGASARRTRARLVRLSGAEPAYSLPGARGETRVPEREAAQP
jgi:flagellar biosynthesis/type III secretory pathway chaperone